MTQRDKIVLITGASSGIGAATARAFAREGARLILLARRADRLKKLEEEFRTQHRTQCCLLAVDVRDSEKIKQTLESLPASFRAIDILVNSAGLDASFGKIQEADPASWETTFDTNVKGLLNVTRWVLPGMIERKKGQIINLGSIAGHEFYSNGSVYCASKAAVFALTRAIQMDVMETPIRVSSVDPGLVETEFSVVRFKGDTTRAKKVYDKIEALCGDDIAECVLFVASRPPHVNIHNMIVFPAHQASPTMIFRGASQ